MKSKKTEYGSEELESNYITDHENYKKEFNHTNNNKNLNKDYQNKLTENKQQDLVITKDMYVSNSIKEHSTNVRDILDLNNNNISDPCSNSDVYAHTYKEILEIKSFEFKEPNILNLFSDKCDTHKNRCYTCKPRGKVKKYIIGKSFDGNFVFHFDLNNRPIILLTPIKHLTNIYDFNKDELLMMFEAVKIFCGFWSLEDYQISYSTGLWKNNDHFHLKIKIPDKIAIRMRGDHFKLLQLDVQYP